MSRRCKNSKLLSVIAQAEYNINVQRPDFSGCAWQPTFLVLGFLRRMLGLSARAKVVDLSSSSSVLKSVEVVSDTTGEASVDTKSYRHLPDGLSEYRLSCSNKIDKDTLLVWLLLSNSHIQRGGRFIIFVNSKSGARRLSGVLRQCPDIAARLSLLHADMLQKQRLRSLERFQGKLVSDLYSWQRVASG